MIRHSFEKRLTAAQQALAIRGNWPGFKTELRRGELTARGKLRGSPITDEYDVRIEYRERQYPKVFVERPLLARRASEPETPIPHTYDHHLPGRERPCVYHPATDWNSTMFIARTVVPWLQCWLVDYEVWLATGTWNGGGIKHSTPKEPEGTAK